MADSEIWSGLGRCSCTWICLHVPIGEIAASLALRVMGSQVAAVNTEFSFCQYGQLLLYTQLHDPTDGTFWRVVLEA